MNNKKTRFLLWLIWTLFVMLINNQWIMESQWIVLFWPLKWEQNTIRCNELSAAAKNRRKKSVDVNVWETFRWNEASWFYFLHAAWNAWCHTRMSGPLWLKTLLESFSRACKTNTTPFNDSYAWHRVVCMIYEDRFSSSVLLQEESIHSSQQKMENNTHFHTDLRLAVTIKAKVCQLILLKG